MRFINIGFGNVVAAQRILAVLSPDSLQARRNSVEKSSWQSGSPPESVTPPPDDS